MKETQSKEEQGKSELTSIDFVIKAPWRPAVNYLFRGDTYLARSQGWGFFTSFLSGTIDCTAKISIGLKL